MNSVTCHTNDVSLRSIPPLLHSATTVVVWLRLIDKIFNVTLIAALSPAMVGVTMTSKRSVELRKLGQFLRMSGVTQRTALRVREAAIKGLSQSDVVGEEQILVVGQISTGLRRELRFDMFRQRPLEFACVQLVGHLGFVNHDGHLF